jgi:hypothetical protein
VSSHLSPNLTRFSKHGIQEFEGPAFSVWPSFATSATATAPTASNVKATRCILRKTFGWNILNNSENNQAQMKQLNEDEKRKEKKKQDLVFKDMLRYHSLRSKKLSRNLLNGFSGSAVPYSFTYTDERRKTLPICHFTYPT